MDEGDPGECPACNGMALWFDCDVPQCEDGFVSLYDEDPLWYDEDEIERCDRCEGRGGWWVCQERDGCARQKINAALEREREAS